MEMSIVESNKMIAEYMGYGANWVNGHGVFSKRNYKVPEGIFKVEDAEWGTWRKHDYLEPEELRFHEDISHLMPVVERIGGELHWMEDNSQEAIQEWQEMKVKGIYWLEKDYAISSNIAFLYAAVVKFIQWQQNRWQQEMTES